jgi:hypothetical protein
MNSSHSLNFMNSMNFMNFMNSMNSMNSSHSMNFTPTSFSSFYCSFSTSCLPQTPPDP